MSGFEAIDIEDLRLWIGREQVAEDRLDRQGLKESTQPPIVRERYLLPTRRCG